MTTGKGASLSSYKVGNADLAGEWDDADQDLYDQRIARARAAMAEEASISSEEDAAFDGGFKVPGSIFSRLFDYQKTGELSGKAAAPADGQRDCWMAFDSAGAHHLSLLSSLRSGPAAVGSAGALLQPSHDPV